ncbi:MAG TPA: helix-turn-helix transcriptional regulator [Planctomycetaceae bacterium]|nr:helix-turn-helix transcriptional regulator [Planctomycetaceae bacterium]
MTSLKEIRIKQGRSQKEVARAAGIDARTLRKIENGEHVSEVSLHAVERVLRACEDSPPTQPRPKPLSMLRSLIADFFPPLLLIGCGLVVLAVSVHLAVGFLALGLWILLAYMFVRLQPVQPNTAITIMAAAATITPRHLSNPALAIKEWLGREDASLTEFKTNATGATYLVKANITTREYADIVARLHGLGLSATVATA